MFSSIRECRQALSAWVEAFDPAVVGAPEAARLVEQLAAIERLASAGRLLAASRVAESAAWRGDGDRSPAHWLARTARTSVSEATATLEAASRLDDLPATASALRAGELTGLQAREITDAASAAPEAETELLHTARRESIAGLRERCRNVKAAGEGDAERQRRVHRARSLYTRTEADGTFVLELRTTADQGARVMAAVEQERERLFQVARLDGHRESLAAYGADALVQLCTRPLSSACAGAEADDDPSGAESGRLGKPRRRAGGRIKMIVRVDHAAIVRGHTKVGETCEIAGIGPIPVTAAKEMMDDAFLAAVVTKGVDVHTVAHLGRQVTAHQRTALEWRDPRCCVEGCTAVGHYLEIDHTLDWAKTRRTKVPDLDRLCGYHHDLKTRQGYRLEPGKGRRRLLAPDQEPAGHSS